MNIADRQGSSHLERKHLWRLYTAVWFTANALADIRHLRECEKARESIDLPPTQSVDCEQPQDFSPPRECARSTLLRTP